MIRLRSFLRRHSHGIALAAVLSALCVALAVEHSGLGQDHVGEAVSMCLAVLGGGALLVAAVVAASPGRPPRPPRIMRPTAQQFAPAPAEWARLPRAGPSQLQVFLR